MTNRALPQRLCNPAAEQVGAHVGGLALVPLHIGRGRLGELVPWSASFGDAVWERGANSPRHRRYTMAPDQSAHLLGRTP